MLSIMLEGYSIKDAARTLGVTPKTIRRLIKDGKIEAELVEGKFGPEYRIPTLPPSMVISSGYTQPDHKTIGITDLLLELKEKDRQLMHLAAQLGAAQERINILENQVKLLNAPKQTFWSRLRGMLGFKAG